jgi:hypothetical protein
MSSATLEARVELAARLRSRQAEIERGAMTRVRAIADPADIEDPEYAESVRAAVGAAVDYGLAGVEGGEEGAGPVPTLLPEQARMAARIGIGLETVLRRYFAGYTLLGDFIIEEAERDAAIGGASLKRLLRVQASLFDRMVAVVSEGYGREQRGRRNTEQRRAEHVRRLLDGEPLDTSDLEYDFGGHHLGAVAAGPGATAALRQLASSLNRRLLLAASGRTVWAWLGSRHPADVEELDDVLASTWPSQVSLAVGEPAEELPGWRLTHRQARAALPIALRGPQPFVRYAEVAVLASILQDDLLTTSLREIYLRPLAQERGGGHTARETLRAYFGADRNVSSAAAALGASRRTVTNRLRAIEERLGRSLSAMGSDLEAALSIDRLAQDELASGDDVPGAPS